MTYRDISIDRSIAATTTYTLINFIVLHYQDVDVLGRGEGIVRRQSMHCTLADASFSRLGSCMWEYDRPRRSRIGRACLSALWLVDTASGFDIEHEDASDASFTVDSDLSPL